MCTCVYIGEYILNIVVCMYTLVSDATRSLLRNARFLLRNARYVYIGAV